MPVNDPTTNYGWNLPNNGGDSGSWGTMLNTILGDSATGVDAVVKGVSNVAAAALPKAGGTMTGEIDVKTDAYQMVNWGSLIGAQGIDPTAGRFFYGTVAAPITFTFALSATASRFVSLVIELTNGGAHAITWPAAIKWPGGSPPVLTASGVDTITMYTRDAGVTWRAGVALLDTH